MTALHHLTTPDGIRLAYADSGGTGRPLLALHGAFGRGRPFLSLADRLGPDWRIVAPDQRGHGHSDRATDYGREAFLADTAAIIERLDLAPCVLVGHSLGGINAFQLAARRPELVAAFVVVDMAAELPPHDSDWLDGLPVTYGSLDALRTEIETRVSLGEPLHFLEGAVETDQGWRLRWHPDDMREVKRQVFGEHWADWYASDQPALVLRGGASPIVPDDVARRMLERPNTRLVTIEDGTHDFYLTHRARFHDAVAEFLTAL
jgi:pimeloyl-ACP methyl ester carboxylesterase